MGIPRLPPRHQEFWALRDVSFEVRRGECLGIIGVNGAGKSTLLKILSRALYPTTGSFEVRGRLVSLLELGTGFQPELTGRQNVFQSAQLLGFPGRLRARPAGAILDFAQIGEFIDRPVRQYSSGMFVRLAFSLFANLDPDVYIVDESLAVGDVFFQQRCFRRFRELRERGCTILLVSHDMEAITHLCDRAILLSGGKLAAEGDPVTVVHDYFALSGQAFAAVIPEPDLALPRAERSPGHARRAGRRPRSGSNRGSRGSARPRGHPGHRDRGVRRLGPGRCRTLGGGERRCPCDSGILSRRASRATTSTSGFISTTAAASWSSPWGPPTAGSRSRPRPGDRVVCALAVRLAL